MHGQAAVTEGGMAPAMDIIERKGGENWKMSEYDPDQLKILLRPRHSLKTDTFPACFSRLGPW